MHVKLGDTVISPRVPVVRSQVVAAVNELERVHRAMASRLQQQRQDLARNGNRLTAQQKASIERMLGQQLERVQTVGNGLITLNEYLGGALFGLGSPRATSGYLGLAPLVIVALAAGTIAVLLAFGLAAVIAAVTLYNSTDADIEREKARRDFIADAVAKGQITPKDAADLTGERPDKPTTLKDLAPWGVAALLLIGGIVVATR
jgi:hypothetical protein